VTLGFILRKIRVNGVKCATTKRERERVMSKLICHADECDNSTSETFFHCEQHGGEDGEEIA
jgi:hypothetical protein